MQQSIIGREAELGRIETFLERNSAAPRITLIEGRAGAGKTTLWSAAMERAQLRSWRVLRSRPTDAEATFAYAGLGDLLEAVPDDELLDLPPPQRTALRVALLRDEPEGPNPEPRAVAVAVLNVIRSLSTQRPVLVAVDDFQWLDLASAQVLEFAMRRLDGDVRFLLARRVDNAGDGMSALDRAVDAVPHQTVDVGPMAVEAISRVLRDRLGRALPRSTTRRIHATSGGNPLYALELGRASLQAPPAGGAVGDLPIPRTLLELVGEPIRALPAATQHALAVVAMLAAPTMNLVAGAVRASADQVLRPAADANIVSVEGDLIRFVHPLHAEAARSRLTAGQQREIHARLAGLLADPEQRARHLALATLDTDEAAAAALEEAAMRAGARGAPDAAAELAALARRCTPPDRAEDLQRRALYEGWLLLVTGEYSRIFELRDGLLSSPMDDDSRWAWRHLVAVVYCWGLDLRKGVALYREAIADLADDERRRLPWEGGMTGALDLLGEDYHEALAHGYAELELAKRFADDPRYVTALRGVARNEQRVTGRMPVDLIEEAVEREWVVRGIREVAGWPTFCLADMLSWTDDVAGALAKWEGLLAEARARGEPHSQVDILFRTVLSECTVGRYDAALAHVEEGIEIAREIGARVFETILVAERALVYAHFGDEPATRRDTAAANALAAGGNPPAERIAAWASGVLALALGDPSTAHEQLGPLVASRVKAGVREPGEMPYATDEVEALIGLGRYDDADAMLDWYEGLARASGRTRALAACARGRGLLLTAKGELDAAVEALSGSIALYQDLTDDVGLARTLHALGAVERRRLHRRAARELLRDAVARFDAGGALLWARVARAEIARIGGRVASPDALTATEEQVARLVAEGRTNREVAAALVVSERTVEGHLSRIYAKVGVRSRSELAHLITGDAAPRA